MKGKILIVDDEEAARKSLKDILKLEGYQAKAVGDGESAIESLENNEYDLILLDLKMPGMDGLQVLEKVVETAPNTLVILLTAHGSLNSAIESLRKGAHDYLLKPAKPNQILASVAEGLTKRADTDRKRRVLSQMEASIQELKDAEGVETNPESSRLIYSLGDDVKVDLERREIWTNDEKVFLTPTEGKL
ncbi:MAG: response regulator, partial [Chloroflexota bacterium]